MDDQPENNHSTAFMLGIIANVLWASSFLGSKYTLLAWGPFTASFLRFVLAVAAMGCLFPLMGIEVRLPRRNEFKAIALVGLFQFGLLYPLQLTGLQHISTSLSAAIMLFSPLLVITLASAILKEGLTLQKIAAVFLGIVGGLTLLQEQMTKGDDYILGVGLTIAASFCLALGMILTRKYGKQIETPHLTFWSMLIGSVFILPFSAFETATLDSLYFSWSNHYPAILALIYLAVICSALTFYIWNKALTLTPAKNLASTMHLKTPVAIIIGIVIAGEAMTNTVLAGTGLVFFGVWLSQANLAKPLALLSKKTKKQEVTAHG